MSAGDASNLTVGELEREVARLAHDLNRAQLRLTSMGAQIRMVEEQRDSWLPWWFRQGLFKFLRRHFPLTRKFLKQFVLQDYLSEDTLRQMRQAHKEDRLINKANNLARGRDAKGKKLPNVEISDRRKAGKL